MTHICPPGYCNCTGSPNDNSTVGCALVYSNDTFSCKPEREGMHNTITEMGGGGELELIFFNLHMYSLVEHLDLHTYTP